MADDSARQVAAWNSPLCFHENSSEKFGFGPKQAESRHDRAARFMTNVTLGPMPVDAFLDEFLQRPNVSFECMPPTEGAFNAIPGRASSESEIYEPLVVALEEGGRCPGFTFRITAFKRDEVHGKRGAIAPDVCCYSKDHAELEEVKLTSTMWESRTFMGYTALFIEVKKDLKFDSFRDPHSPDTDRSTWKFALNYVDTNATSEPKRVREEMSRALGQNTTYAAEMFARQHRHCCFSATLSGPSARLIRWDRTGAIVSEAFDIRTPSGALHLCQFLWCFAHIGDVGRGYDLTVMTATRIERELFVEAITQHAQLQMSHFDKSTVKDAVAMHCSADAISVIEVPDSSGDVDAVTEGVRRLLISRPIVYPHFLTGRATRAYWAVEAGTRRVVFLKDTWREDPPPSGRKEGDTILHLIQQTNQFRSPERVHCPPVVCHADVPVKEFVFKMFPDSMRRSVAEYREDYQATKTQEFLEAQWVCGRTRADSMAGRVQVKKRVHYRLVLEIAGLPLDRFSSSRELLICTYDIFGVLSYAAQKAGICHRDITPENIIIYRERKDHKRVEDKDHKDIKDKDHKHVEDKDHKRVKPRARGYLIDWDLAWPVGRPLLEGGLPFSGTWQFVANRYRNSPTPDTHKLEYDIESLLYVVIYCALLWLPHNSRSRVEYPIETIFGEATANVTGGVSGGSGKSVAFQDGGLLSTIVWDCAPLQEWVTEMRQNLSQQSGENWVTIPLYQFWKNILKKKTEFPVGDRIAELPPLNGLREDGNIRFVGPLFVATTVPSKRPFHNVTPDSPNSADIASTTAISTIAHAAPPADSTAVLTTTHAPVSSTIERDVRGQLAKAMLSSLPAAPNATSASTPLKSIPELSKAGTHSGINPMSQTGTSKVVKVKHILKRRRQPNHASLPTSGASHTTKKGKKKEVPLDTD